MSAGSDSAPGVLGDGHTDAPGGRGGAGTRLKSAAEPERAPGARAPHALRARAGARAGRSLAPRPTPRPLRKRLPVPGGREPLWLPADPPPGKAGDIPGEPDSSQLDLNRTGPVSASRALTPRPARCRTALQEGTQSPRGRCESGRGIRRRLETCLPEYTPRKGV